MRGIGPRQRSGRHRVHRTPRGLERTAGAADPARMAIERERPSVPSGPVGVRLMVDFSTGRLIGVDRPAPAAPPQAFPRPDRGPEPPPREAA
jgi:hypothetical protein